MRPSVDSLAVVAILLAAVAVLWGFGFLLWIVTVRAPDSLATQIETVALASCLFVLALSAGDR